MSLRPGSYPNISTDHGREILSIILAKAGISLFEVGFPLSREWRCGYDCHRAPQTPEHPMTTTITTRMSALRARMAATATDLVVIGPSSHMLYLADLSPHGDERPVLLMVSPTFAGFLMPALNVDSARQHTDLPFFPWTDADGPAAALEDLLAATGVPRISPSIVLDETMRADFALLVIDALPGAIRRFTQDTVGYLRSRKDDAEYGALKKSAVLNDAAMAAGFAALRPGITEREVATAIRDFYKANGATTEFCSVCFD